MNCVTSVLVDGSHIGAEDTRAGVPDDLRWKYALVLVGLAMLHDEAKKPKVREEGRRKEEENGQTIEVRVEHFTRALAPVLLPMIDSLGALEIDALSAVASGEAT